jgi:muconolactone delta-isomerase
MRAIRIGRKPTQAGGEVRRANVGAAFGSREAPTMEYLVTMTTHVPAGTSDEAVVAVRAREAAHSRDLAERGALLRLWRPPVEPDEWRTLGLFAADDEEELEKVLASMPLRIWRSDEVTPLLPHPNDPAPAQRRRRGSLREFFTIFTIRIPAEAATATVDDITRREAARAGELAGDGALARLWLLLVEDAQTRALGLWRASGGQQMQAILDSLPMSSWMTVETIPLSVHPSDPAAVSSS